MGLISNRQHTAIPNLMSAIGVVNPPVYPDDHFDLIYTVPYPAPTYSQSAEPADCTFPAFDMKRLLKKA